MSLIFFSLKKSKSLCFQSSQVEQKSLFPSLLSTKPPLPHSRLFLTLIYVSFFFKFGFRAFSPNSSKNKSNFLFLTPFYKPHFLVFVSIPTRRKHKTLFWVSSGSCSFPRENFELRSGFRIPPKSSSGFCSILRKASNFDLGSEFSPNSHLGLSSFLLP